MSPDQWGLAWRLFHAAAELPPDKRRSFLDSASNDPVIVGQVLALLEDSDKEAEPPLFVPRSNTQVSHYRVGESIGRGGMGEVYEGTDLDLDRRVAIKFLPEQVLSDERAVRRFIAEAKSASAVNHPNLVTIHEFVREDKALAIVMEYVEGQTLRVLLPQKTTLDEFLKRARQLAEDLAAAHSRGIIHRDLKPENIMVRADGYTKILDFGLAGLADAAVAQSKPGIVFSTAAGTLHYMSPEQKRNVALTPATDIYSLGIVFVEMLSGSPDPGALPGPARLLPRPLSRLVADMLKENPKERPSAAEIAGRLVRLSEERPRVLLRYSAVALTVIGLGLAAWEASRTRVSPMPNLVPQPLTTFLGEEYGVSFSPDGERIVFSWDGERQDNVDIYEMDLRNRVPRRLTSHPGPDRHPAWSPDGKTIPFHREGVEGRGLLYLLPAAGDKNG